MPLGVTAPEQLKPRFAFEPAAYADLPGWHDDDHAAAFQAFVRSAAPVLESARTSKRTAGPSEGLLAACRAALAAPAVTSESARQFFEQRFLPHRVVHDGPEGLLTGYYEPLLEGSRVPGGPYVIPIYRRPPDLVNLVAESERGALADGLTHARQTASGIEPYTTRAEIESGALADRGLEFLWLKDPVDTFFMHIQGSGCIRLPDGSQIRITYDGKNGHPYTSIGRYLIDAGEMPAEGMSLDALKVWLKADAGRGQAAMWQNKSFVFFRELKGAEAQSPMGVLEIPLSAGRSLAVDTAFHIIGTPIYVTSQTLRHAPGQPQGFRRLMIAQDVGSAIRGPERGDVYFGSGDEAGRLAGVTKHAGTYFALLPHAGAVS